MSGDNGLVMFRDDMNDAYILLLMGLNDVKQTILLLNHLENELENRSYKYTIPVT